MKFLPAAEYEQKVEPLSKLLTNYTEEKKSIEKLTYENNGRINMLADRLSEIDRIIIALMNEMY